MKKIFLALIMALVIFSMSITAGAQIFDTPIPAEVIEDRAFVRETHDTQAKRVATLEEGDGLRLLEEWIGGDPHPWYRIEIDGGEGWIYGQVIRRLDGGRGSASTQQTAQVEAPAVNLQPGIMASDENYVTVIAVGQGTERSEALEQAWIEAVRLAVGAIISSTSELNNNEFAENTIAHSRGVVEGFDIIDEKVDGRRISITIHAKVRKEILVDAAKTYSEAQTVKADTGEVARVVKAQLDDQAMTRTAEDKQSSGVALLKEVLDAYGPEMFYSATLDPKIHFDENNKRPYWQVSQKFNEDLFWQELLPKLRTALDGVAVKKEKKFYINSVQEANQDLAKQKITIAGGLYKSPINKSPINSSGGEIKAWNNANRPYSWQSEREGNVRDSKYPSENYSRGLDYEKQFAVIVPDNTSSYTVYYLDGAISQDWRRYSKSFLPEPPDEHNFAPFIMYLNKMDAKVMWSISFYDKQGNEIGSQAVDAGKKAISTYRSYYANSNENSIESYSREAKTSAYPIFYAVAFAPGFLSGDQVNLYLDTVNFPAGYWFNLDTDDLQKVDSMKFEVIFENQ